MKKSKSLYHLLLLTLCLCVSAVEIRSQTGGTFDLSHSVIATGGGSNSAGGQFQVDGTAGQGVAGTSSTASVFDLHGGFWFQNQPAAAPQIIGTVTYGNAIGSPNPRFVSNVTITAAGSPNVVATTTAPGPNAGQYTLTGFGAGSYTVTPTKTGGANSITSFDAARVAQYVAGTSPLNANQLIVADVSGNGVVSSFDAALIAKYATGGTGTGQTGTWKFIPVNRNYASVTTSIAGEDFAALLMGEVSGNWNNTGAR
ncbi:MAG: dockerin type I repeat-containing protein [Pyrinomonadaceae bacterium]